MTNTTLNILNSGESCPGCEGTGLQLSYKDGLKHRCPACGGTGIFVRQYFQPFWYQPQPQWVPNPQIVWCTTTGGTTGTTGGSGDTTQ